MPDIENVIKGLEIMLEESKYNDSVQYNPYADTETLEDALALLKAQEPVKPTLDIRHGKSMWRCGTCSTALQPNQMHAKFCFNCGRAVKWE